MPDPIGGVQPFAELARNGATVVYKGYQRTGDRFVLLKAVRPELGAEPGLAEQLAEEARLAAQVRHPNVVAVLEAGHDGLTSYLITEFVEGLDLRALVARGPLPPELAAFVVLEAARGLAAVHASGILHRDLKPANVLVSEMGEVKLADFGLASLAPDGAPVESAEVCGTLPYLAPEVVRGEAPGPAADLFALGSVLAELLTGHAVFDRESAGATLDAVLHHDPVPTLAADPRVPPALVVLAAKLLAKDPAQRVESAALLIEKMEAVRERHGRAGAEALAAFVQDPEAYSAPTAEPAEEVSEEIAEPAPILIRPVRRRVWSAAALIVLAVLLALGYAVTRPEPALPDELAVGQDEESRPTVVGPRPDPTHGSMPEAGVTSEVPEETSEPEAVALVADPRDRAAESDVDSSEPDTPEPEAGEDEADTEATDAVEREMDGSAQPQADPTERPEELPVASEPVPGALVIAAEPWAEVHVDGEPVGTTPLRTLTVPAGPHTVTFQNPDFPPRTVQVEVAGGETARVAVSLWDLVGRVTLLVSPWARVSVDGTYWDTVPPQNRPLILTPGTHRLVFEHPALDPYETTLRIAAGEARTVRINLADRQP